MDNYDLNVVTCSKASFWLATLLTQSPARSRVKNLCLLHIWSILLKSQHSYFIIPHFSIFTSWPGRQWRPPGNGGEWLQHSDWSGLLGGWVRQSQVSWGVRKVSHGNRYTMFWLWKLVNLGHDDFSLGIEFLPIMEVVNNACNKIVWLI